MEPCPGTDQRYRFLRYLPRRHALSGVRPSVKSLTFNPNTSTATATLSSAPGFVVGQDVVVSGAAQSAYDGTFPVTAVTGDTFSYLLTLGSPTSPDPSTTITVQPCVISTTTSYTDTSVSSQTQHSYQVAAVNYDGVVGGESTAITARPAGIAAIGTPTSTSVRVQFTEPVDPTTAQNAANYSISGVAISAAVLQSDGYTVYSDNVRLGYLQPHFDRQQRQYEDRRGPAGLDGHFHYSGLPAATSVDIGSPGIAGSSS